MANLIIDYVTYKDIDLNSKLGNMLDCEISTEIYHKCYEEKTFKEIENKVWELINDTESKFAYIDYYEGLAKEYEAEDENDMWSACLYNCDLLYMVAIAYVLDLEIPKTAGDIRMFWNDVMTD